MASLENHSEHHLHHYNMLPKKSLVENWFEKIDQLAVLLIVILFFLGLTVQAIAASELSEVKWGKYALLSTLGLMGMFVVSMMSRAKIMFLVPSLFLLSIFLMLLTLTIGIEKNGATRWLAVPLINMQFQPMELYKVSSVSTFAIILGSMTEMGKSRKKCILLSSLFIGLTIVLGWAQPDLGQMTIVVLAMLFVTVLALRLPIWWLFGVGVTAVSTIALLVMSTDHGRKRVLNFFSGDVLNESQQGFAQNSLDRALLFGRPEGDSRWQYLPDVETDYVFVLIAEEFGLMVGFLFVGMLVYLFLRFKLRMWSCEEIKLNLWVWGLLVLYSAQIFINVTSATNIGPTKGITLPIFSYGGSAILSIFFAFGLLLFITRRDIKDT